MKILVINTGSSSLKFRLFDMQGLVRLASGLVERIGEADGRTLLRYQPPSGDREEQIERRLRIADHGRAMEEMLALLGESGLLAHAGELAGIGHRVVHGGETFHEPVRIDDRVLEAIAELVPLAPLHNPANLVGIRAAMARAADVPQVAVFDTAFHQALPEHAYLYGLPFHLYEEHRIRRYGFHGTSHGFVSRQAAAFLGRPYGALNSITLHLGNGASAAAIRGGRCVDTSMGLTPLEGLLMGTRSGDLDPAILLYLARETGMDIDGLDDLLNRKSGLRGICGDNDMRAIIGRAAEGDGRAALALRIFCYRIKKYIGAYTAVLGRVDCLVFTGGIGENAAVVRETACRDLEHLGIVLDRERNQHQGPAIRPIHHESSDVSILVVPTNEELEIARQVVQVLSSPKVHTP